MADASRSPYPIGSNPTGSNPTGSNPPGSNPPGWADVFAALPLEAPPASVWPAIATELDHHQKRHQRNRSQLALAASLFALAALPLAWLLRDAGRDSGRDIAPIVAQPAAIARTATTQASADPVGRGDSRIVAMDTPAMHVGGTARKPIRAHRQTMQTRPAADVAQPRDAASAKLETLYSASAQLETLLMLARDTRVESGPAAALSSAIDAELATIDAQLAQPGLATLQQQALWQARIDTLQQATGFETNQRLLSSQGRSYDGALVSVE